MSAIPLQATKDSVPTESSLALQKPQRVRSSHISLQVVQQAHTEQAKIQREPGTNYPTFLSKAEAEFLRRFAHSLSMATLEVLLGQRQPSSIQHWLDPVLYEQIREHQAARIRLARQTKNLDRPIKVRRLRMCPVSQTAAEVTVAIDARHRVLGMRFQRNRTRWRLHEFLSL